MGTRARRFFARFNRLEFSAPLVEASSGYPELLGQLIDAFTALHPLYGHALKLPGISLSSLHECFLSRRVCPSRACQFKGSFHLLPLPTAIWPVDAITTHIKHWYRPSTTINLTLSYCGVRIASTLALWRFPCAFRPPRSLVLF